MTAPGRRLQRVTLEQQAPKKWQTDSVQCLGAVELKSCAFARAMISGFSDGVG
jgi:hypothetical protein